MLNVLSFAQTSRRSFALVVMMLCGCSAGLDTAEEESDALQQESGSLIDAGLAVTADGGSDAAVDAGPPPNVIPLLDESGEQVGLISARGRGCPLGAWDAEMAADGLGFTITFQALRIQLAASQELATSGCTLTILPPSEGGRQFSAASMSFSGQARLDENVVGALELRHYAEGSQANTAPGHTSKEGPFEGTISLRRDVADSEARWTSCTGRRRGVNVDLLMRLSNTWPRATGTLHGDIEAGSKLAIQLRTRACAGASR